MIDISRAHYPVTTLGVGRRIGIWFQGCSIRCKGCVSQDTWATDPSKAIPVGALLGWCKMVAPEGPDGVTISGGEPFDQPAGLSALLDGLMIWRAQLDAHFDLLCYSGYRRQRLLTEYPDILRKLDILIPEPFMVDQTPGKRWRGSKNQPLVGLSELGREVYRGLSHDDPEASFQIMTHSGQIWLIGVPRQRAMDEFADACRKRGLILRSVSWSP